MQGGVGPCAAVGRELIDGSQSISAARSRRAVEIPLLVEDQGDGRSGPVGSVEPVNQIFRPATIRVGRQLPHGAASLGKASLQAAITGCPIKIPLMVKNHPSFGEVSITVVGIELVQYFVSLRPAGSRA